MSRERIDRYFVFDNRLIIVLTLNIPTTVLATYKDWKPLISQSTTGGTYRYTDDTVSLGGWVYRVSEVSPSQVESDLCQALVEVQSKGEKLQGVIAAVGFGIIAIGSVVAGVTLDPMQ